MRGNWTLPIRVSIFEKRGKGKLGLVELRGAGSAGKRAPNKIEQYSYGIGRTVAKGNPFCFKGTVDGKFCFFKVDTGSDVSILSRKFLERTSIIGGIISQSTLFEKKLLFNSKCLLKLL